MADKYATVVFKHGEREKQREFLLAMNGAELIQVSREDIENWFKEDTSLGDPGCENHIVLHGDEEVNRFAYVMGAFFSNREYLITDAPNSEEFKNWLESKA